MLVELEFSWVRQWLPSSEFFYTIHITQIAVPLHIMMHLFHLWYMLCMHVCCLGAWNAILQISLWDGIIPSKEHAKFWIHTSNKYRFIDQVYNSRRTLWPIWFASDFFRAQIFYFFMFRGAICVAKNITWLCIGMLCRRLAKCLLIK